MRDFENLGYRREEEFLEDLGGCNDNYTLDEVLFDWFPNASTDEELEDEFDCWGDN